jgi:hypothetical protein
MMFAPTDIDITITPESIAKALARSELSLAVNMSLHLGVKSVIKSSIESIDVDSVELVVMSLDLRVMKPLLNFLAEEISLSQHLEYYLCWCWSILRFHGQYLQRESMRIAEALRALIKAISLHEKEIMKMSDENQFTLEFLSSQFVSSSPAIEPEAEASDPNTEDALSSMHSNDDAIDEKRGAKRSITDKNEKDISIDRSVSELEKELAADSKPKSKKVKKGGKKSKEN